jgi:glycosyltransferase involved in cell wall biosynthesis
MKEEEKKTTCCLVITTYNWPQALNLSLRSILNQSQMPNEIIIADDGSTHETYQLIKNISKEYNYPIKHCWQEDNGFRLARSRNNAIIESNCDYIVFIDGDIITHKDFILDHMTNAEKGCFVNGSRVMISKEQTLGILSGKLSKISCSLRKEKNYINSLRIPFLHKLIKGPQYTIKRIKGCNMAFWKDDLLLSNGFDENYVGWGREDSDIAIRLMNMGLKRKNLKFAAIAFHIFHNEQPKQQLEQNHKILLNVITQKLTRANIGIYQH